MHWLKRYGIILGKDKRVWCCQTVQFVIERQQTRYPSLNSSCAYWGLGQKLDFISTEYWDKGINTDQIPWDHLSEYGRQDVDLTHSLFLKQQEYLRTKSKELCQLIKLLNQDLIVLAEMEWNGLVFDAQESRKRGEDLHKEIIEIDTKLLDIIGSYPVNFNSPDHVSCILYGGIIEFVEKIPYEHTYKTGLKAGETHTRYHAVKKPVKFEQLVEPLENSGLDKVGYFSTSQGMLKRLKAKGKARSIISLLTQRAALEQLKSTYYFGWPETIEEMDWPKNEVHSNLNQSVVITGRLSSSTPNQQNVPEPVYNLIKTRFQCPTN